MDLTMIPQATGSLAAGGTDLVQAEMVVVGLLAIAAVVAVLTRLAGSLPYTVALLLAGLVLTFLPSDIFSAGGVLSEIILFILVPPLVFEATLHLKWEALRRDLPPILLLAVLGSLIGSLIIAAVMSNLTDLPFVAAFVFGALISATDPVAVIAFFRSLGVSQRLALLVEGESLLNDGVAIVIFSVALGVAEGLAAGESQPFQLDAALIDFVRVAGGGLLVGILLGYVMSNIILRQVDDHLIETAWTVALAFGTFLLAEQLHLSGILAVVAAGMFVGNVGTKRSSPTTQITLNNFWEFLAFTANSFVFLLIGLDTEIGMLLNRLPQIIVAVLVVLAARAVVVYGLTELNNRINPQGRIRRAYRHIMWWGGLRGAISLALALSLVGRVGLSQAATENIEVMTYGVVLFTLLAQATTLPWLLRRLALTQKLPERVEQQRIQALLYARRAGREAVARLHDEGLLATEVWRALDEVYEEDIADQSADLLRHLQTYSELKQDMVLQSRLEALKAERSAISNAQRRGLISEEVHHELARLLDERAAALDVIRRGRKE